MQIINKINCLTFLILLVNNSLRWSLFLWIHTGHSGHFGWVKLLLLLLLCPNYCELEIAHSVTSYGPKQQQQQQQQQQQEHLVVLSMYACADTKSDEATLAVLSELTTKAALHCTQKLATRATTSLRWQMLLTAVIIWALSVWTHFCT